MIMNASVIFSPRVLHTINSLPESDRQAVASAVTGEFILGSGQASDLTPMQSLVMVIIRQYVRHDMCMLAKNG